MKCKDCGIELIDRNKNIWTQKFLDSELCFGCFRINESIRDPESTKYLDIEKLKREKKERMIKRKIICSVCRKELSEKEYERYEEMQKGLIFNWGTCQGKEAHPIITTTIKKLEGGKKNNG